MKKSTAPTGRSSDKFMLRLPDGMRDTISELAKASGRSMNAEIVYRLQKSISDEIDAASGEPENIGGARFIDSRNLSLTPQAPAKWNIGIDEEFQEILDYIRNEMKKDKNR
ncbi:Arc family DNA-binding protein [Aeromonas media]|uniref:Arc family DNA-binding protein n=1 Tax=Aeromonas media TaxID=651 RepID=UPI00384C0FC3